MEGAPCVTAALRTGFTTGACAAAAAKAAALTLAGADGIQSVDIPFPDGTRAAMPVLFARASNGAAESGVRKFAGDDPDVTDGAVIVASVSPHCGESVTFVAGDGVGTVTKPGLQIPPGEPAINPGPRRMILDAVREATSGGLVITLSIPGGSELAGKTFNPRLGVRGGLSILGTTGRVRPFSVPALRDALVCSLDVAAAAGIHAPVLVPGNVGERAARRHFALADDQIIHVSNEWGFMLAQVAAREFKSVLVVGHPGKLAKLADGEWDTHSSRSPSAVATVAGLAGRLGVALPDELSTVEGAFESTAPDARTRLGNALAAAVRTAVQALLPQAVSVALVNMQGDLLGTDGELTQWQ
jgi:cobalt-precorrin-5B (C1)-methyltransferase